jgi:hypothetical protein
MAVEDAIVFADETEDGREGVVGRDEWDVLVVLASEIIDLQVVGMGLHCLGCRKGQLPGL